MSETRPIPTSSLSFSGSSSASAVDRPLKRRISSASDLNFFTPAATSFKPRSYYSVNECAAAPVKHSQNSRHMRSFDSLAIPSAGMEPNPSDPNSVFIHPPFTSFPNSRLYPDGLSYSLMADNPDWFLDATDFLSLDSSNPNAIPYPPNLEPPRGWCPAKKKDLKERGADGWPEGEEPRLRCTFCRRTYAGVNAKSMWRRHVFEKHKIAMSNRRDGDRPRGRGSNKENRQHLPEKNRDRGQENLVQFDVTPQHDSDSRSTKSKFSLYHAEESSRRRRRSEDTDPFAPSAPIITQKEFTVSETDLISHRPHPLSQSTLPPISPPSTPSSPSANKRSILSQSSSDTTNESPQRTFPTIPPSPYDPLLTPSFRHSPPRLPSDQPWRFPSPSHPLHSSTREICLSMLAPDGNSPAPRRLLHTDSSPASTVQITPLRSPGITLFGRDIENLGALRTPHSMERLTRRSPRTLFSKGRLHLPFARCLGPESRRPLLEDSPLSRNSTTRPIRAKKALTDDNEDSPAKAVSSAVVLTVGGLLPDRDPFVESYSWSERLGIESSFERGGPAVLASPQLDSPVLRQSALPNGVGSDGNALLGLGIGLMEPFVLPGDNESAEFEQQSVVEELDEAEVAGELAPSDVTPPLKKRKIALEG